MDMDTVLIIIGCVGLVVGLVNPKIYKFLFQESATRPIIILVFGAIILAGAFWKDPGSTGAIGLFCVLAMIIGMITPDAYKPLLKKFATRPVLFWIFLIGLIMALSFDNFGKHVNKPDINNNSNSKFEKSNQRYVELENRLSETRNLLKDQKNDQALKDVNNILLSPIIENDPKIKAEALRLRGDILYNKGIYENAKRDFENALITLEILQMWEQQAWCYYYLAEICFLQKDNTGAISNMLKAEELYIIHDQKYDTGLSQGRLGDFYRSNNQHTKALMYYQSARDVFAQTNNIEQIAWINCYWSISLDQVGKTDEAINKLSAAIDFYKSKENYAYLAWCYEYMAPLKMKLQDKVNALANYQLAIDNYKKVNNPNKITELDKKIKDLK